MSKIKFKVRGSGRLLSKSAAAGSSSGPILVKVSKKRKKKRSRRHLRPMEKAVRRMTDGLGTYYKEYGKRHKKSSRKKRDGWLRDGGKNQRKALRKAQKKAKVPRLFRF